MGRKSEPPPNSSDVAFEKGLPCNVEAERFVLGSILLGGTEALATVELIAVDFSLEKHRRIYLRMRDLAPRLAMMRGELERGLNGMGAVIFGADAPRIPNTSYFAFPGIEGETLVIELDQAGFAVASGAACSSTSTEPSATLLAMGVAPELARGAVRLSLGKDNQPGQVADFLHALQGVLGRLKRLTAIAV